MRTPVTTKAALLQALSSGPSYGAEISTRIKEISGIEIALASIYPALISLEDEGLAREKRSKKGRTRGVCPYELTAKGKREAMAVRIAIRNLFTDDELRIEQEA